MEDLHPSANVVICWEFSIRVTQPRKVDSADEHISFNIIIIVIRWFTSINISTWNNFLPKPVNIISVEFNYGSLLGFVLFFFKHFLSLCFPCQWLAPGGLCRYWWEKSPPPPRGWLAGSPGGWEGYVLDLFTSDVVCSWGLRLSLFMSSLPRRGTLPLIIWFSKPFRLQRWQKTFASLALSPLVTKSWGGGFRCLPLLGRRFA